MSHGASALTARKWLARAVVVLLPVLALTALPTQAADCQFILGFATLKALIDEAEGPDKVGECLEDQRFNPANGDALQQTTGGLLVWRKLDNWTAFTDGYRTWINGPHGLQARLNTETFDWEAAPPTPTPTPVPNFGDWQFRERTDVLTGEVRKTAYLVAHTRQGYGSEMPELLVRCTVGKESSGELSVWWKHYIGGEEHPVATRIDEGIISEWPWSSSTNQQDSFAPYNYDGFWVLGRLQGYSFAIPGRPERGDEPSEFVARVTKPDKTTITGVWSTPGIYASYTKLISECGLPSRYED